MLFSPNPETTNRKVRVFSLSPAFLEQYKGKQPKWGPVGHFTYMRTYSRKLCDCIHACDHPTEDFWQTCQRVVEGCFNLQKIHCRKMGLPWDEPKSQKSAQDMFRRMWNFKFTPPGRGLWMMGTDLIYEKGSAPLLNCSFVSTEHIGTDFASPFCFLMDMSMLGVGVGGDTRGVGQAKLSVPRTTNIPHVVEDSREGWVEVTRQVLNSFVGKGSYPTIIDYTKIRRRGEPLKGFGGIACGPDPLKKLVGNLTRLLMPQGVVIHVAEDIEDVVTTTFVGEGEPTKIMSSQIVDVFNFIGKCLPGDVWVMTVEGPRQVKDLVGRRVDLVVNGQVYPMESNGFFQMGEKQVYRLETEQGWEVRLTADHRILREDQTWVEAQYLNPGDRVVLHEHVGLSWGGEGDEDEGYVLGMLVGDGSIRDTQWGDLAMLLTWDQDVGSNGMRVAAERIVGAMPHRVDWKGWRYNGGEGRQLLSSKALTDLAARFGIVRGGKTITDKVEQASSAFSVGFLRGLFDSDGSVNSDARCITLSQNGCLIPKAVQRMLGRLGILSSVFYAGRADEYVLYLGGFDAARYMDHIGFNNSRKEQEYYKNPWVRGPYSRRPVVAVKALVKEEVEPVYDVTVAGVHAFDANGMYVHNCVVAGGIRRTAEIIFGEVTDQEFLSLKSAEALNPLYGEKANIEAEIQENQKSGVDTAALEEELTRVNNAIAEHPLNDRRWASNNSLFGHVGMDYTEIAKTIAKNGEPGLCWLENARQFGRMADPPNGKDHRVMGTNPCFAGETLIAVADGRGAVPIKQLAEEGQDVPVYSVRPDGKVEIQMARNPRLTRELAPLVEVVLDDGNSIKVTPDHKMLLLDGTEVEAQALQAGDSLPRFSKEAVRLSSNNPSLYIKVKTDIHQRKSMMEHRLIAQFYDGETWNRLYEENQKIGWVFGGLVVHHKDFDSTNNDPANLEIQLFRDHVALHNRLADVSGAKNPMWGRKHSDSTRANIGRKTRERCANLVFLQKLAASHSVAERMETSERMSRQRKAELLAHYKEQEAHTDLDTVWMEDRLHAVKVCETCGEEFVVPWRIREQSYCSRACGNKKPESIEARKQGQNLFFANRQRQVLHQQVMTFKDIQDVMGRDPMKAEWEAEARERRVPVRFRTRGSTTNPYALHGYRHLKQVASDYNHRVVDVRVLPDMEPVYNLTVDHNHTLAVVTSQGDCGASVGIFTANCGEQSLEPNEACNLVETYPAHHDDLEDFRQTLKMAYLYAKTVTLVPTHDMRANQVMQRNRRIGCSISGIAQARAKLGHREFIHWCDEGYAHIARLDRKYSEWLGVPPSVKTTSIKPSGSVSLLCGATPGIHFPHSEYYLRRIRVQNTSPLVAAARAAGYDVELDTYAEDTSVISFPVHEKNFEKGKTEVSIWEQFKLAADMQAHWADNQVSVTVTFGTQNAVKVNQEGRPVWLDIKNLTGEEDFVLKNGKTQIRGDERDQIASCLSAFEDRLKSVSLLPVSEHGYAQAPYEEIDETTYTAMKARISPLRFGGNSHDIDAEDLFCSSDSCTVDFSKRE